MKNVKSKASYRVLAVFLSLVMVFSMIPFSIVAQAATTEYPDSYTVTVTDGENPIEGASVNLYQVLPEDGLLNLTSVTDTNGVAAFVPDDIYNAFDAVGLTESTVKVSVSKADFEEKSIDQLISIDALTENVDVVLVSTSIDVEILGKNLTYTGEPQELVSKPEVEGATIEYYLNGAVDPVTEVPTATDAGTYSVRVVITCEGKTPLDETVETVINPAYIEGIEVAPIAGLKYNGTDQELVTLTGLADGDTVTWTVDGHDEDSRDIPKRMAVGSYTVKLTVDRGSNYIKFERTVDPKPEIALGDINLGNLIIKANDRTYDGAEQPLLDVTPDGDYTLEYSVNNQESWVKDVPTATDAGTYVIYVKATKENYNDKNTPAFPITVTIAKKSQSLAFAENAPSEIILGTNNEYDFAVTGENLSGNDIEYSLVDGTDADVATITTADAKLTVAKAGIVTVKALRAGDENHLDAVAYKTIVIKNTSTDLVAFDTDSENYVFDENGVVSEKAASKANSNDNGNLSYSIDKNNIGLAIDSATGKITVESERKLAKAMGRNGSVLVTVTANKTEGSLDGVEWIFAENSWKSQSVNKNVFASGSDEYTILITYAVAPAFNDACKIAPADPVSGWYNAEYPATITPIDTAKYTIALDEVKWSAFGDSVTIEEQGTETHYVYLKNKTTRQISAAIAVDVKVDDVKPEASRMKIEYAKSAIDEFFEVITLGFYKPSVTIKFTAYDETSGIDYFTWNYTKEAGASDINHPASIIGQTVTAVPDANDNTKYTAEVTITADEANQYRGYLTVTATDKANNTSAVKEDNGNVFVVDTVNPQMSIKYEGKDPYTSEIDVIDTVHYFDGDVEVELTITEANFYAEDVEVLVTKDGQPYNYGSVDWGTRNAQDQVVGTFTLSGDGDYIVAINAMDKSGNAMASYTSETITVDKIAPVIDSVYNKEDQNITITIEEHNFRPSDITVGVEALDINDDPVSVNDIQVFVQNKDNWTDNGDIHTLVLESTGEKKILVDAIYKLTIGYEDISNNPAATEVTESSLIDHTAPDVNRIKIEYSTSLLDTALSALALGFYNPDVEVTFTAYDEIAGVDTFTWFYDRQDGASETILKETTGILTATRDGDVGTAKITLPLNEAEQLRGHISVQATDTYGNISDKKTDNDKVIIVDTIAPKMTVEYSAEDNKVGTQTYHKGNVEVTLTVTEANFFMEDVIVTVSKDKATAETVDVQWYDETVDIHIGKFTLSGDGDYVVFVEYKDRSNNLVTDNEGNVISYVDEEEEINKYKSHIITIDTIDPVINVTYDDNSVAVVQTLVDRYGNNRNYYAGTKTATVSITEHNFNAADVDWDIVAKDVSGNNLNINGLHSMSGWSTSGDTHTLTITYAGDANYTFDMNYTDLAKRSAVAPATAYFTVDKTAPANLRVDYSTSILDTILESVTFGFYNAKMTVTLTAVDPTSEVNSFMYSYRNAAGVSGVNAEVINEAIQAAGINYSGDRMTATVTFEIPKMVLGNDNQFNGSIEFTATDRANNTSAVHKETKRIVVDNIAPTAEVSYNEAANVVGDVSYYDGNITTTITINEANFYANDVKVMVSKNGAAATAVTPSWRDNGVDVHVGTFTLTEDGDYFVTIDYADKSSNKMVSYTSKQMTIDTKIEAPAYTINDQVKTEVGGAYKGEAKIGFSIDDQNFDTMDIELIRTRFDKVEDVTGIFVEVNENNKGGSGSFTIPAEVENDGIYVLKITMTDKAKHEVESEIKFTINRYGSVYEYSDELVALIKDGGQYIKSVEDDLVITEYNADRILEGSLQILITRDGENVDVDFTCNPENINAQVGIGESGWYQYVYTIKASNFEEDGVYKVSLASKYATDDSSENDSTSVPENSVGEQGEEILDTMNFTVDSVAPEIRNIVNLDKKITVKDKIVDGKLNVKYTIVDVGGLKTIEIIVKGETIQTLTAEDIADNAYNFTGSFDLEEQNGTNAYTVQIRATDLAGNVTDTESEEFLMEHSEDNENSTYVFFNEVTVSRNFFVRWYANTGLFWGSIAGVIALAGGTWFVIAAKKKKEEDN